MSSNPFYDDGMEPLPRTWWDNLTDAPTKYRDKDWEKTQAAVLAWNAARASKQARRQASMGVTPPIAARQAAIYTQYSALFWIFIGMPTFFILTGLWAFNIPIMVWKFAMIGLAYVLLLRLENWKKSRADRRYIYRIPTWVLLTIGGVGWLVAPVVFILGEVLHGNSLQ